MFAITLYNIAKLNESVGNPGMRSRRLQPELMDDPALIHSAHKDALCKLERINRMSRAAYPLARAILRQTQDKQSLRLLDVATGSGDVAMSVSRLVSRRGVDMELVLCDVSTTALNAARDRMARHGQMAELIRTDVVSEGIPLADRSVDVTMCSLFLHHLKEESVAGLLRELARVTRLLVVVSDLRRCRAGLLVAHAAGILSGSSVVRVDAPRSVQGAFTEQELASIVQKAVLSDAHIQRIFPFRMLATWAGPDVDLG